MATNAPNTGAPAGAPPIFNINGTEPFNFETPGDYVRAAHAVACLGVANGTEDGKALVCNDRIIMGGFEAITLLLAHAERLIERDV